VVFVCRVITLLYDGYVFNLTLYVSFIIMDCRGIARFLCRTVGFYKVKFNFGILN